MAVNAYAATIQPVIPPAELYVRQLIEQHASGLATSTRSEMLATVREESGYNTSAHNLSDPYGGAIGCAQFLLPTFNTYAPLAGVTNLNIWDCDQQIQTMTYMFSIGEAKQWTCWRRLFQDYWLTCHKPK